MLEIENFRSIDKILIKDTNYNVLTGNNEILLRDICEAFDMYFNEKKISKWDKEVNDKTLIIQDYFSKEKEKTSYKCSVLIKNENIEEELLLGSKTLLYNTFNNFFKNTLLTEPIIMTINSLIKDLNLEENIVSFNEELTKYADIKFKIELEELGISDFIKKITITPEIGEKNISLLSLNSFEKLKLQLGIVEKNIATIGKDKIYIFIFPEKNLALKDLKKLKNFLYNLSKENKIIVATFSNYLFDFSNTDNINIYFENYLSNSFLEEELLKELEMNYPILISVDEILKKLKFVLKQYLLSSLYSDVITNKFSENEDVLYIENFEYMFLLLFYLKKSKIPYAKDLNYDYNSPFSNYIEEKL